MGPTISSLRIPQKWFYQKKKKSFILKKEENTDLDLVIMGLIVLIESVRTKHNTIKLTLTIRVSFIVHYRIYIIGYLTFN